MSELIWKIKQFFRKIIPIALIVGLCYGGFTAYKRGLFGRKLTYQIISLGQKIPFFGSKFSMKTFGTGQSSVRTSHRISKSGHKKSHRRHHARKHSSRRKHRSRR